MKGIGKRVTVAFLSIVALLTASGVISLFELIIAHTKVFVNRFFKLFSKLWLALNIQRLAKLVPLALYFLYISLSFLKMPIYHNGVCYVVYSVFKLFADFCPPTTPHFTPRSLYMAYK